MKNHIDITLQFQHAQRKYDISIPEHITFKDLYHLICTSFHLEQTVQYPVFKNVNKAFIITADDIVTQSVVSNGDLLILLKEKGDAYEISTTF
ncbi:hypothetical protein ROU88_10830 [Macrococcus capreoli]|uniref:hypothetical protein n=1 Tax=Macrococcus capreoli TaxID=2982690 RepID=UPI0021D58330|nr:hypothetical protein [Macrococcus sp. TMW 2.2395]MCU7557224.1 hypothetical protein [Macrococcus sp. TMW 2.2395]